MPIDYLTLMLINMVAGLVLLALYVFFDLGQRGIERRRWVIPFSIVGVVALITGFHMALTWQLPGAYNIPYGEFTAMLGALFIGAAISLALGWDLLPLGVYAFFAGIAVVLMGVRFLDLQLSQQPALTAVGFFLTGLAGIFAGPALYWRDNRTVRTIGALVLVLAAIIWALTGYQAYWTHMGNFAEWVPVQAR